LNDRNQANQAIHSVTDHIPQETKDFMAAAKAKILDSDKLRSFQVFFGIGESDAFSFSLNPAIVCPKLKNNLIYFYLNYLLLSAVIFLLSTLAMLMSPQTLIVVISLMVAWFLLIRATRGGSMKIFGLCEISRKSASFVLMIVSGVVAFFLMQDIFYVTLGSGSIFALMHAWTRNSSQYLFEQEESNALEMTGDMNETV
jgi:hypothetical protein